MGACQFFHANPHRGLLYRCADCGARSCCEPFVRCTGSGSGMFSHRWRPMGTGKPYIQHGVIRHDA